MAGAETVFFTAAITVGLSGAVGYGLYRIATIRGEAKTATDYGRKWLAWMQQFRSSCSSGDSLLNSLDEMLLIG